MSPGMKKVTYRGNTYFVGANLSTRKVPKRCVKRGQVCAYRIRMTGIGRVYSACGYCYYTERLRNCDDPIKCDKWAKQLPDDLPITFWDKEENALDFDEYARNDSASRR